VTRLAVNTQYAYSRTRGSTEIARRGQDFQLHFRKSAHTRPTLSVPRKESVVSSSGHSATSDVLQDLLIGGGQVLLDEVIGKQDRRPQAALLLGFR